MDIYRYIYILIYTHIYTYISIYIYSTSVITATFPTTTIFSADTSKSQGFRMHGQRCQETAAQRKSSMRHKHVLDELLIQSTDILSELVNKIDRP